LDARALLSLHDVVAAFRRRTGITISTATADKYLRQAGFNRSRPQKPGRGRTDLACRGPPAPAAADDHRRSGLLVVNTF
jgi:hypothetical protein